MADVSIRWADSGAFRHLWPQQWSDRADVSIRWADSGAFRPVRFLSMEPLLGPFQSAGRIVVHSDVGCRVVGSAVEMVSIRWADSGAFRLGHSGVLLMGPPGFQSAGRIVVHSDSTMMKSRTALSEFQSAGRIVVHSDSGDGYKMSLSDWFQSAGRIVVHSDPGHDRAHQDAIDRPWCENPSQWTDC